jgi:hypothetical protein
VQIEGEGGALVEAQVVQSRLGMSLSALLEEVYGQKLDGRLSTEMLIIRLPVEEHWPLETFTDKEMLTPSTEEAKLLFSGYGNEAFTRVRDRAVHILTSDQGDHLLTKNINPEWKYDPLEQGGITVDATLNAIRRFEFEHILNLSRAVIMSVPGSTFRAPSGGILRSFVRVGNIQYNRDAIDAIFFWLLPHLKDVGAILTDTWSISSLALNIGRLCEAYFGGARRVVEMLPSYNDGSLESQARTRSVIQRLNGDHEAVKSNLSVMLCLISATQTGSLARHLTEIIDTEKLRFTPRPIALFALGETKIISLHDLSNDARFKVLDKANLPASSSINIDPQIYFPLRFEDIPIEIKKNTPDRSRAFFDRYVGTGLIETHRTHNDGAGRVRHHAIHLATEKLVKISEFVRSFQKKLEELVDLPKLIVSPPHKAGQQLAKLAREHFLDKGHDCPVVAHETLYLGQHEEDLRRIILEANEADTILIVDDVFLTGTRLSQYQRYTRNCGYKGRIDYLVGISRPKDHNDWIKAQRILSFRPSPMKPHTLQCVDEITLPDWRVSECPWCVERDLYSNWSQTHPLPKDLVSRLDTLQGVATTGLENDLFLKIPSGSALKLGPHSFFTSQTANQAEVFAAVSATLQCLRTQEAGRPSLGPRRFPVSTVLNHEDYLCEKWTDSILRATFLRAAITEELTYASTEKEAERTKLLMDLIVQQGEGEHDIVLEVLLAAALGKCNIRQDEGFKNALHSFGVGEVGNFFLDRIQQGRE